MIKKKILYLMHVDWGWIKQRPHFLAEHLNDYFDVTICCDKSYRKRNRVYNSVQSDIKVNEIFILPFSRYVLIDKINLFFKKVQLKLIINRYQIIWITSPLQLEIIKDMLPSRAKLVYDCMDDFLEIPGTRLNKYLLQRLQINEKLLIVRSDFIITSSNYLRQKLLDRYGFVKEIAVVNNALLIEDNSISLDSYFFDKLNKVLNDVKYKKIVYMGTISEWIDIELILDSLETFRDIVYIFIGPAAVKLQQHSRIFYFGPMEHKYIYRVMSAADVLIMPFKINELILSVNPVKMYEYIYSCKPTIAVRYAETLPFEDYAYLYANRDEYFYYMKKLVEGKLPAKKKKSDHIQYALNNTWAKRAQEIYKIINAQ